jgi:hypothetical protein
MPFIRMSEANISPSRLERLMPASGEDWSRRIVWTRTITREERNKVELKKQEGSLCRILVDWWF